MKRNKLYYWKGLDEYLPNKKDKDLQYLPYHFSLNKTTRIGIDCSDYLKKIYTDSVFNQEDFIVICINRKNADQIYVERFPTLETDYSYQTKYPEFEYYYQIGSSISKFCTILFD